jgi:5-amino-6-(5-phosphoribosylamino)uracil reductase
MRRLYPPDPAHPPVDPSRAIAELGLADRAPPGRPFVVANFVSSADGRATVDGGSTGLGDDGDKAIFRTLRGCADAVLAGTGTLRAEHYGILARDPAVVALRARLGLAPQPPLVTITRSGRVPAIPLLDDPGSTLLVYSGAPVELGDVRATVRVIRREPAQLTASAVLADLRTAHGVRLLLCEGGPSILGELVAERVVDELYLTLAATLAGGDPQPITAQLALAAPRALTLRWVLEQEGSLYLRYGLDN